MQGSKMRIWHMALLWICTVAFFGCDKSSKITARKRNKPVKFIVLRQTHPEQVLRLTGSAKAWREEKIAFEVHGRVAKVLEENVEVGLIPQKDADGTVTAIGEVVAELDTSRYDATVTAAKAKLASTKADFRSIQIDVDELAPQDIERARQKLESVKITLEKILPNELKKAQADLELARAELNRAKELYENASGTQRDYDRAKAQYDTAISAYETVKARVTSKQSELEIARADQAKAEAYLSSKKMMLEVARANVSTAMANLQVAQRDRDDCILRAPFSGVISQRLVSRGAVVGPSQPVVKITMMDPIMIEVAVSAQMARNLQHGDPVQIFPATVEDEAIYGWVVKKSVVADARTRTYNIFCVVRNRQIAPRGNFAEELPRISRGDVSAIWREDAGDPKSSLMVWTESIDKDSEGYFTWLLEGFRIGQKIGPCPVVARKIRLKPGDGFKSFVSHEYLEVLEADERLTVNAITMRKDLAGIKDGVSYFYTPLDWMIRPGDLVPVLFGFGTLSQGIYAPVEAILKDGEGHHIFICEGQIAKKIAVRVGETFRNTRRIEADVTLDGKRLVVFGAHYVRNGDSINASLWENNQ